MTHRAWYRLGIAIFWILLALSVTGVAAAVGVATNGQVVPDVVTLLLTGLATLAGALAFVFKQWLQREKEWRDVFLSLVRDMSSFNTAAKQLVDELSQLNNQIRKSYENKN